MAATAITDVVFRIDRDGDGRAHIPFPGTITARCGRDLRGPVVTEGVPCDVCLELAAKNITGTESPALAISIGGA